MKFGLTFFKINQHLIYQPKTQMKFWLLFSTLSTTIFGQGSDQRRQPGLFETLTNEQDDQQNNIREGFEAKSQQIAIGKIFKTEQFFLSHQNLPCK